MLAHADQALAQSMVQSINDKILARGVGLASLSQPPTVLACNTSNLSSHVPALHSLIGSFILQQLVRVGWVTPS